MTRRSAGPVVIFLLASAGASALAASEDELNALWRGAWVVTGIDGNSNCGANYTNNEVRGRLVSGKGDYRFEPGELAHVHKINLHRKKVEVLVDLAEPLLVPHREGPFTLYDELHCKIEYQLPLRSRSARDVDSLDALLASILERHSELRDARASEAWNGRQREPYPADYEETLAAYETWKTDQINVAVGSRIEESIERAARLVDRIEEDPEYLAGFAAGVDQARDDSFTDDCERLLSMSPSRWIERGGKGESREWREGFEEGQVLVFHLELARRLRGCFLPPPL